jgi:trans-2-enoyl-CoA reductase
MPFPPGRFFLAQVKHSFLQFFCPAKLFKNIGCETLEKSKPAAYDQYATDYIFCSNAADDAFSRSIRRKALDKTKKEALQVAKEIVVKFIETGRISPNNFPEFFDTIYNEVLKTITSAGTPGDQPPEK